MSESEHSRQVTRTLAGRTREPLEPLHQWGPFELRQLVGAGGFGEVYDAWDPALRRQVAVKLLRSTAQGIDSALEDEILREARAMARVTHPNLVPIYGVQIYEGRAGLWSAFVRGKTLTELVKDNGPFSPTEAALIGLEVSRACSAIHSAGLLHCDIKASNVMREAGGRILLMDFGLAEAISDPARWGGTPAYMAPELLKGSGPTPQTDIYALGVLIYFLLTAKYPENEPWKLLQERPDLPAEVVRVVMRALDPEPAKRYSAMAELAAALSFPGQEAGSFSQPLAPPAQAPRRGKWLNAAAGIMLVAAGAWFAYDRLPHSGRSNLAQDLQPRYDRAHRAIENYYEPNALAHAIADLTEITRRVPEMAAAWTDLGRAQFLQFWQYRDVSYVEPARLASLRAIELNPNLAGPHVTLGMLYTQTDRNELAEQELTSALNLDRLNAEAWGARAELYLRQGRTDDSERAIRQAMDLAPSDWRWPKQLAIIYQSAGKNDLAIEADRETVRLSPKNARAWNNLGAHLMAASRYAEAREPLLRAATIEPGYNRFTNLAVVEQRLGNDAEAEQYFRKAIELNTTDYRAWFGLASLYRSRRPADPRQRETYAKAISLAEPLYAAKPREGYLVADLGSMYAEAGDSGRAEQMLRKAVALSPENAEILVQAGIGFEVIGKRAQAISTLGRALEHGYPPDRLREERDLAGLIADKNFLSLAAKHR